MFIEKKLQSGMAWINLDADILSQHPGSYKKYNIDEETIEYALDKNERAHMDYNRETGTVVFIFNVLNLKRAKNYYETVPMTFVVQQDRLITISNKENTYVVDMMKNYVEHHEPVTVYKFLFASLELVCNSYYPVIEQMDETKDNINHLLHQTTTKKNLFALADLETSMVYLVAAAKQNRMLLEHIRGHAIYRRLDEVEKEQFDDVMIEARQLVAMTDLISQVLSQLSGSYNNILNNNLNDNLTVLTIISVLLAVLAVITGFFGMNVPLPLSNDKNAWIYIVVISLVIWGLLTKVLKWLANKR
ncbi:CorA-like Mg2+ transporter protein [Streptococcus intermedius]|uniref:CorA-like magnesium transporter n=4 Tax=Streptococcus intermedius TaxID=1338 RepID=T1ZDL6_STRIT|nr:MULTISPECIES: magnesium transporter CorA family protein [Streptococcus]RKW12657.1 MAG: magnesium transporter CorA family protein [Catonella sp.]AGU75811.1 CorA-like magnesium transporter [Streptococcus intermedius B196]AGU77610.1 CorA-like magnesium transporter [Streptococcus intermedius C270]EKU16695.1 corA-like Mg2+ transporter family protein [Streptococcus intermedius BA1]MDN5016074.1 magnesium transporter CorA family protein [Streptococcus sp. SI1]